MFDQDDSIWLSVVMFPDDISDVRVSAIEGDEVGKFIFLDFFIIFLPEGYCVCDDIKLPITQDRMAPQQRRYNPGARQDER